MEQIVLGLVAMVIGGLVAGYGVRAFFVLLPLFGFLWGASTGTQAVQYLVGDGAFATVLSWVAGLALGAALAIVAGLFYWAAIVILAAGVGATVASGILIAIGFEPGLLTFVVGLAAGAALALLAILIDAPTLLVALLTAFGGMAYAVAGAYVLLGQVTREELAAGAVAALRDQPLGFIAWLALGAIALGFQLLEARARGVELMTSMPRTTS
jgi:hypothetical protein